MFRTCFRLVAAHLTAQRLALLLVLLATGSGLRVTAQAPITLVQHASKDAGTTASSTLAFPAAPTTGNWLAVVVRAGLPNEAFTVTDSRGNTYRKAVQFTETVDTTTLGIFYAESIAGGANTVTVSDSASATLRFAIFEYAGVASVNSFDGSGSAQGTSSTPTTSPATTTAGGDLVIGLVSTANPRTFTAGSGYVIQEQVPAAPNAKLLVEDQRQLAAGAVTASASLNSSDIWGAVVAAFRPAASGPPAPDLTLAKTHSGTFTQGQVGATYTLTATNSGTAATSGLVTVTDTVPTGLTATAMTGTGWACSQPAGPCTRSDVLAAGASYPAITLTVAIASNAASTVTNTATVAGGGETNTANDTASDLTPIAGSLFSIAPRVTTLTFNQRQQFTATGTVTWLVDFIEGGSPDSGTITSAGLYTPPTTAGTHTVSATSQSGTANATAYITNYPGTFTRDVDNLRTGLNARETVLTPANVNVDQFGKLFSYNIDGVSDASPLYVADVNVPNVGVRNIVYVATEHDSVYAFDADGLRGTPYWQVSFINPPSVTTVPPNDTGEPLDISPEIGITGSPVIDPATNTLYVVAKTKQKNRGNVTYSHRLHALDIRTGAEKFGGPALLQASVAGTGAGATGSQVPFISLRENQRAALLLSNGVVYIAFAAHGDQPPYHGWVLGYNASTLQQVMAYNATPDGAGGGIWQSGDGLATDSTGNIYFVTGNGDFNANTGGRNYGDSFVKISPAGAVLDFFTPHDQQAMANSDLDLGSGGTTLLPDQPGPHTHLAISAGKNGTIYLVDRDNMGQYRSDNDNQIVQSLANIFPNGTFITGNFKAPVYWNSHLYFSADADFIKSFQVTNGLLSTSATSQSSFIANYPGATLGMSSHGNADALLWAIERIDHDPLGGGNLRLPGVLHAFDATNLAIELYNSTQAGSRDVLDYAAKWASPLIANGKVFVATNGRLTAYGLLP
jgi:uncharacterized repeat protein (TIGR01451 family)